jgi:hypothetical protein
VTDTSSLGERILPAEVTLREYVEDDFAFIKASYVDNLYENNPIFKDVRRRVFEASRKSVIASLVRKANVSILCETMSPREIVAYFVWDRWDNFLVAHFMYVKYAYRKMGLAKFLLANTGYELDSKGRPVTAIIASHWNSFPRQFGVQRKYKLIYNPDIMVGREEKCSRCKLRDALERD